MKPKKKSNAVFTVLLFLFAFCNAHALILPADTIIIDGETIFIEKNYQDVDMDSLEKASRSDLKKRTLPVHFFSAALHAGLNETIGTYGTSMSSFEPFNNFVEDKTTFKSNFTAALDIGAKFWEFPAMNGTVDLAVHAGVAFNKVNIQSNSFDTDSLIRDRNILLRYTDQELVLEYFKIIDPEFQSGELDTAIIPITKSLVSYAAMDVPLKLHAAYSPVKSKWNFNLEAGILSRFILQNQAKSQDFYLVNSTGEYLILDKEEFKPQRMLRPVFSAGAERRLESKSDGSDSFFSIGTQLNAVLPATALNSGSLFYTDVKSYGLTLFVRFHL